MTDAADRRAQAIVQAMLSLAEQASGRTLRFRLVVDRDGRSAEPVDLMAGLVAAALREFRREADGEHVCSGTLTEQWTVSAERIAEIHRRLGALLDEEEALMDEARDLGDPTFAPMTPEERRRIVDRTRHVIDAVVLREENARLRAALSDDAVEEAARAIRDAGAHGGGDDETLARAVLAVVRRRAGLEGGDKEARWMPSGSSTSATSLP